MLRSILAVVAGLVFLTVASFAIEAAIARFVESSAVTQQVWFRLMTMGYTLVCVAGGGYVAARLARQTEVRHALVLGAIEVVFTIGAMLQLRGSERPWIWIAGIALIVPAAWLGAMIRVRSRL
jgi:hypothetical protein